MNENINFKNFKNLKIRKIRKMKLTNYNFKFKLNDILQYKI